MQILGRNLKLKPSQKSVLLIVTSCFVLFIAWQFMLAAGSNWHVVINNKSSGPLTNFVLEYNRCTSSTKISEIPANSTRSIIVEVKTDWGLRVKFNSADGTEYGDLIPVYYPTSRDRKMFIDITPDYKVDWHESPRY